MDKATIKRLEKKGWTVGNTYDFLGFTTEEKGYNPLPIEKIREIEKAMLSENRYFKGRTIRESIKLEGKI